MIKSFFKKDLEDADFLEQKLPNHVAFIMDGNGRWATKRFLPRLAGHNAGVEALREIIRFSSDIGIGYVTFYAFSTENWGRPQEEVSGLMELLVRFLRNEIDELHENNVKIVILGELSGLPQLPREEVMRAIEKTKDNTGLTCCIALNYGSRFEIVSAVKKISQEVQDGKLSIDDIDEKVFANNLYTSGIPDPDLMVRTSGELRLSNYLLWQLAYSEFYFTDVFWPDFNKDEYIKAIKEYQARNRRYGKV